VQPASLYRTTTTSAVSLALTLSGFLYIAFTLYVPLPASVTHWATTPSPMPTPVHVTTPAPEAGFRPASSDGVQVIVLLTFAIQPAALVAKLPFVTRFGAAVAFPDVMSSATTTTSAASAASNAAAAVRIPMRLP